MTLAPDLAQIVSQSISFLILLWLLRRFAWRPLLKVLDERRARIEQDLKDAAQQKAEFEHLQEEYRKRIATIEDEARAKIQQAVLEGKRIGLELQDQARAQARTIIAKSQETIELELAKAKVSLRDQLAEMTMDAVERILHQRLDAQADRRLIEAALDELEQVSRKS